MIRLQGAAGRGKGLRSVLLLAARLGSIDLGQGYHEPTATRDHSTVDEAFIFSAITSSCRRITALTLSAVAVAVSTVLSQKL